jgi:hypothetical protein
VPYRENSLYVLANEAIPEIARRYFNGDTYDAKEDVRTAAQDRALSIFSDSSIWGEPTPFHRIDSDVWYRDTINWAGRRRLYFQRADLLKIYPGLWSDTTPATEGEDKSVPVGEPDAPAVTAVDADPEAPAPGAIEDIVTPSTKEAPDGDSAEPEPPKPDMEPPQHKAEKVAPLKKPKRKIKRKRGPYFNTLRQYFLFQCRTGIGPEFLDKPLAEIDELVKAHFKAKGYNTLISSYSERRNAYKELIAETKLKGSE